MTDTRISAQVAFLKEADRLKRVDRSNVLLDLSRPENSAEHSWHLALYALIFTPMAGPDVSLDRVIRMLLLHDLVEIDVGDHPIHEPVDWGAVAECEQQAARRIFGILPDDQAAEYLTLWTEFEGDQTPDAQFAKMLDRSQPLFQVLCAPDPLQDHLQIVRDNLASGRAAYLQHACPEIYWYAKRLLGDTDNCDTGLVPNWLTFLAEADQLKSIYRASRLIDDSRFENSAEHSWHIMLYAMVLSDQAGVAVQIDRVLRMLLIHDIVEIDAGDAPIHGQVDHAAMAAKEEAAAERLFGLLPEDQYNDLHALWHEFEAAETPDAQFAKSVDRVQTPIANLENGGGSWVEYKVTLEQIDQRVGVPVERGAPGLWAWLRPQLAAHFNKMQTA